MRSSKLLGNRWLKGILLAALPLMLYALIAKKTPQRPQMILWSARPLGADSYPTVTNLAFHPDGVLATATDDASVRLWDTSSATLKATIDVRDMPRCGSFASPFAFSPNGQVIASVECDGRTVKLWDARTGSLIRSLVIDLQYHLPGWDAASAGSGATHIAISPDTKTIAVAATKLKDTENPGAIQLWDVATGKALETLHTNMAVFAVAFSPDSRTLVSAGGGLGQSTGKDEVKLWSVRSGKMLRALPGPAMAATFSPDGKTLAVGGGPNGVSLWNVQTGQLLQSLKGRIVGRHGGESFGRVGAQALVYSPDGTMLAGAVGRHVYLWDAHTGDFLRWERLLNTPMTIGDLDVGAIAFSPDSHTLAIAGRQQRTVTLCPVK